VFANGTWGQEEVCHGRSRGVGGEWLRSWFERASGLRKERDKRKLGGSRFRGAQRRKMIWDGKKKGQEGILQGGLHAKIDEGGKNKSWVCSATKAYGN